ncbi:E2 [Trichechus manatus latirostris papillomavirus 2]|uniref:Regulatory protein E2 n=1 Tax=Trichechus manatus latirostris papillomavirus 2 TaxID=1144379 RepID=H6UYR5_9PAPI|nr:E2 gene product [Trichechus manatus latirostris papillomavirus 2]AFA26598.1 E2 [Trichechus manatus latirostris papillomavirus 2]
MEALLERLNVVQEGLLQIYERGLEDLDSQIEHWECIRRENVLYHMARKSLITRLGYQPIPTLQVSQAKAKTAIEMSLNLRALKENYGQEKWTMQDTSEERYKAPPTQCFKKGGFSVDVCFDGEKDNRMSYTAWTVVYHQTDVSKWEKASGGADFWGCYYHEGTSKTYYITFMEEAQRYGHTGVWEVHTNSETYTCPSPTNSVISYGDRTTVADRETPATPTDGAADGPATGGGTTTDLPDTPATGRHPEAYATAEPGGDSRTARVSTGGRPIPSPQKEPATRPSCIRAGRSGATGRDCLPGPLPRRKRPGDTGGHTERPAKRHLTSVGGGLGETCGEREPCGAVVPANGGQFPIILVCGGANQLKCWRYRTRSRYAQYFTRCSTTWTWACGSADSDNEDTGNKGSARLVVGFDSTQQRTQFMEHVPIPRGVSAVYGELAAF